MRVVHVAPTLFGLGGIYGGGERYPLELGRALARNVECELVSFGRRHESGAIPGPSASVSFAQSHTSAGTPPSHRAGLGHALAGADIVHAHHREARPAGSRR